MKIKMKDLNKRTLEDVYSEFELYCKSRNLSPETIKNYNCAYGYFSKFCGELQECSSINESLIQKYILYLKENTKASDVTISGYIRCLKAFLNFCMKRGYIPKFTIENIKCVKKIKEAYTEHELALLTERPNLKKCRFSELRNWALCCYLLATGNRLRTVLNLKIEDLNFEDRLIALKNTKNGRQQLVPMSTSLIEVLQEYLSYRGR